MNFFDDIMPYGTGKFQLRKKSDGFWHVCNPAGYMEGIGWMTWQYAMASIDRQIKWWQERAKAYEIGGVN